VFLPAISKLITDFPDNVWGIFCRPGKEIADYVCAICASKIGQTKSDQSQFRYSPVGKLLVSTVNLSTRK
jgi:hypothetical protein